MISSIQRLTENKLYFSRGFIFLGAFTLFFLGIVNELTEDNHNDPFWLRALLSGILSVLFLLTFVKKFIKHAKLLRYIALGIGSLWCVIVMYTNNYDARYTTAAFTLLFLSILVFEDLKALLIYLLCYVLSALAIYFFSGQFHETSSSFIYFFPLAAFAVYFANSFIVNAKQRLAESNDLIVSLMNSTNESYLMIDEDFKIIQINAKARLCLFDFHKKVPDIGDSVVDFYISSYEDVVANVNKAFAGEVGRIEYNRDSGSTESKWYDIGYYPVEVNHRVKYVAIAILDVTKHKEIEEVLTNAKEKAEEANKAKTDFLSVMSHEIRTPMNAVIGLTNLLLEDQPRQDQLSKLKTLKFSTENLMVIINDILDYNKIESGKIVFENQSFSLRSIIQNIKKSFEIQAENKGLELSVIYDESIPEFVKGDAVRLTQILMNLISNAIKFTHMGQIYLRVRLVESVKNERVYVYFEVEDTGVGIDQKNFEKIFDTFSQESSSTTRQFGGTGLGLAIIKKLLTLQGSQIYLESEKHNGSKFYFELAFEQNEEYELPQERETSSARNLEGKKVLLVEDNAVNRLVAKQYLNKWNLVVDVAENGEEAVFKVLENHYDIILMDLQMPIMDGFESTKVIRNMHDPLKKNMPIIALTASALFDVQKQVWEASMNSFVTKPFDPEDLYNKIYNELQEDEG